jgi:uncharacterized protein YndB with AHSA1/START domain
MTPASRGFLMLADISGYTRFLTGVELEHSRDLVASLLSVVVDEAKGVMELAKLEGDAVFCYEDGRASPEAMVTLAEAVYFGFRRWRRDVEHLTTCRCEACRRIPDLDLKILVHRGEFATHEVAGNRELLGRDVILVHRLLKNTVRERTGIAAYALFTEAAAPADAEDHGESAFVSLTERIEDVGETRVLVLDLARLWTAEVERTAVVVKPGSGADLAVELPAPPAVVWDWLADPARRRRWNGADRIEAENPGGIRGPGTQTHCVHGRRVFDEEIVDWKPHRYVTIRTTVPGGRAVFTIELDPDADGTALGVHIASDCTGARGAFVRRVVLPKMRSGLTQDMARLRALIDEERAGAIGEGSARSAP